MAITKKPYDADAAYRRFNRRYFGRALPRKAVIRWRRSSTHMGAAFRTPAGPLIILNAATRSWPKVAELTLLHEMVHIATGDRTHGKRFQQAMLKLAKAGALADLW